MQKSILLETCVNGRARNIRMYDVLHVPDLPSDLLLVSKLISRSLEMHFNSLGCEVRANNCKMLAMASLESKLYQLDTNMMKRAEMSFLVHFEANSRSLKMYHAILWHLNTHRMKIIQNMVNGMDVEMVPNDECSFACEECV